MTLKKNCKFLYSPTSTLQGVVLSPCPHLNPCEGIVNLDRVEDSANCKGSCPINIDLVLSMLCVYKSLALSKVDRAGKFLILYFFWDWKFSHSLLLFWLSFISFLGSLLESLPHCINLVTLLLWNEVVITKYIYIS
jgi:hypothetical protein